jgi:hypothetical protein
MLALENLLDAHNFHVILIGNCNAPGFDWNHRLPHANSLYYSKPKGDAIFTRTCLLDLRQRVDAAGSSSSSYFNVNVLCYYLLKFVY